ncbi:hypothetical protein [Streptomyces sp. NPDC090025]|uniref:hypothetical protein n=1 Tax=Streptomyces sp. NPDC090025 TaxID=3365922 RepID=UPI0038380562
MNDTPGWTSPGSAPSDGHDGTGIPGPAAPADAAGPDGSAGQWSKQQPPAGQWQPPSAATVPAPPQAPTPTYPGPGWGGQPPQRHWGPPAAAKPGVIPLRPLTLGDILDGAVTTMRRYWRTVLTISVTVAVFTQIADILFQRFLMPATTPIDPDASPEEALTQSVDSLKDSLVGMAPAYVIIVAAGILVSALLTVVVSRAVLGKPVTLGTAWQEARPRLLQLLGLTLIVPLAGGVIMFVGLLPGMLLGGDAGGFLSFLGGVCAFAAVMWMTISFSLASPALMLERQGVVKAMKRSAKLVQGSWWRIFGITLLTQVLIFLVQMVVAIPFLGIALAASGEGLGDLASGNVPDTTWTFLIITGIGGVVTSAVTYPFSAGVSVLLYIDQRIRREALDLELARAAGLPGYGG